MLLLKVIFGKQNFSEGLEVFKPVSHIHNISKSLAQFFSEFFARRQRMRAVLSCFTKIAVHLFSYEFEI